MRKRSFCLAYRGIQISVSQHGRRQHCRFTWNNHLYTACSVRGAKHWIDGMYNARHAVTVQGNNPVRFLCTPGVDSIPGVNDPTPKGGGFVPDATPLDLA